MQEVTRNILVSKREDIFCSNKSSRVTWEKLVIILFNSIWDTRIGKGKKKGEKQKRKERNKPGRTFLTLTEVSWGLVTFFKKGGWDKSSGNSSWRHSEWRYHWFLEASILAIFSRPTVFTLPIRLSFFKLFILFLF